ncbi:NUDIX domain-containing protein [Pirellulaceae bacterium]|nr:NUDIX domain-containing protein [Pirellulaceae bacterium]
MSVKPDKTAVIGLVKSGDLFLTIQRSATVRAPLKWCFPGGTVEKNESHQQALRREFVEEMNLVITPVREVWTSLTPWNTELHWWTATAQNLESLVPNPAEVADYRWLKLRELRDHSELLESNVQFLDLVESGDISLEGSLGGDNLDS